MADDFGKEAFPELKPLLGGFEKARGDFSIVIEGRFDSSHYLCEYFPDGGDEPMHGHSWRVRVRLARIDGGVTANGISIDFLSARRRFDMLLARIDHICINDLAEFQGVNPTSENVARWFYAGLRGEVEGSGGRIREISVYEGPENCAVYEPPL
jgi:6-pyruvoyltetrahydropterin/6-carboxytetrahydropterin synthase